MNLSSLERKLQKADRKQAVLYLFCNFVSLMLITAYSAMMLSPTVQNIFPEGGDSRKQMYAIFVLALVGCIVFTIYASTLFFRKKSRQLGILMALGASRRRLAPGLFYEVLALSCSSSIVGILAGVPLVLLLWQIFRTFLVNSEEMALALDFRFLFISAGLFLVVTVFACMLAFFYLRRTNIIDVVQEEHKNEPVKELGSWCGPVGILLLVGGAIFGYYAGSIYQAVFHKFSPAWVNLAYLPVFIGLYMIMLHTVVHGWISRKKNPYKNIIARSMMKFQGKQTVNSLLVSTVLIAGGCFAIFYIPILSASSLSEANSRLYDYGFHYRADQTLPDQDEITQMADRYDVAISDWIRQPYITLGIDGNTMVEKEDGSFYYEYREMLQEVKCLSESSYNQITGQNADIPAGSFCSITNDEETGTYWVNSSDSVFTNPKTLDKLSLKFDGYLHFGMLTDQIGYYVLDDEDYAVLSQELSPDWKGELVYFNVNGEDNYQFAAQLYHTIIASFDKDCLTSVYYNRIEEMNAKLKGTETEYFGSLEQNDMSNLSPDASDFRLYWAYMPKFRILTVNDFMQTFSVFLMTFLFICIICLTAAMVIGYTRCQTIALNNRYVFDDLKKLGASPSFLMKELRQQCQNVFRIPVIIGMSAMSFLYGLILFANDGKFTMTEIRSFILCLEIILILAALFYGVYTHTIHRISRQLEIK